MYPVILNPSMQDVMARTSKHLLLTLSLSLLPCYLSYRPRFCMPNIVLSQWTRMPINLILHEKRRYSPDKQILRFVYRSATLTLALELQRSSVYTGKESNNLLLYQYSIDVVCFEFVLRLFGKRIRFKSACFKNFLQKTMWIFQGMIMERPFMEWKQICARNIYSSTKDTRL